MIQIKKKSSGDVPFFAQFSAALSVSVMVTPHGIVLDAGAIDENSETETDL